MVLHLLRERVLLVDLVLRGRLLGRLLRGVLRIHVHERLLHLQCVGGLPVSPQLKCMSVGVRNMQEVEIEAV